ncbi:MAG: serine hydrolase [Desulfobacterales bacterium]|nr:serine hydrolase [Desulfobacterales bacterium]
MNDTRDTLQHLLLAAILIVFLAVIGCRGVSTEKGQSPDYPSLRERTDEDFQEALVVALRQEFRGQYKQAVEDKKAAMVVVDITDLKNPKVASVNPDVMLYAASLPKIAILLGAFVQIERGEMTLNDETRAAMTRMIRNSSNKDATDILNQVGFENLAQILQSEKYRLYDLQRNGGLWIGRDYSGGPRWKGDPLHNISHGATAMQAARFYYLAETGRLVSDQYFADFVEIMSKPGIRHKFVKGVQKSNPEAEILRKSGTWKNFHADSGIIVNKAQGYKYIIVALVEHLAGNDGLARFAMVVDQTMENLHKSKN